MRSLPHPLPKLPPAPRCASTTPCFSARANARAGGEPLWLQGEEYGGEFLLQFDEGFANVNLGDCGIMFVFSDEQFWQCH